MFLFYFDSFIFSLKFSRNQTYLNWFIITIFPVDLLPNNFRMNLIKGLLFIYLFWEDAWFQPIPTLILVFILVGLVVFNKLEVLDLGYNALIGSIPQFIWNLSSLQILSLRKNMLNSSLPSEGKNQMRHYPICIHKLVSFFFNKQMKC